MDGKMYEISFGRVIQSLLMLSPEITVSKQAFRTQFLPFYHNPKRVEDRNFRKLVTNF